MTERAKFRPYPGAQEAFCGCSADIAWFGGAPGGGKSKMILYEAGKWTQVPSVRGLRALLLRRSIPDITGGGGLWDESQDLYREWRGRPRVAKLDWWFEAGSGRIEDRHRIQLTHLQHEETVEEHKSLQYAVVCFDQLETFTPRQFWYMQSRTRSMSGVQPYTRATLNADPDGWVRDFIDWWIGPDGYAIPERSGVVRWIVRLNDDRLQWFDSKREAIEAHPTSSPLSFTFILSLGVYDNPGLLEKDPGYIGRLMALGRGDRLKLIGELGPDGKPRGGNWNERDRAGAWFPRSMWKIVNHPPSPIVASVRFWDKAGSAPTAKHPNPDWSRAARVNLCEGGELYIDDLASAQVGALDVMKLQRETAIADGVEVLVGIYQDTGGAGLSDVETTRAVLDGFSVEVVESWAADTTGESQAKHKSSRQKRALARVWVPDLEAGRVYLKRAAWNDVVIGEAEQFPNGRFDDCIDSISGGKQVLSRGHGSDDLVGAMANVRRSGR